MDQPSIVKKSYAKFVLKHTIDLKAFICGNKKLIYVVRYFVWVILIDVENISYIITFIKSKVNFSCKTHPKQNMRPKEILNCESKNFDSFLDNDLRMISSKFSGEVNGISQISVHLQLTTNKSCPLVQFCLLLFSLFHLAPQEFHLLFLLAKAYHFWS